jgi:hypothetical protein
VIDLSSRPDLTSGEIEPLLSPTTKDRSAGVCATASRESRSPWRLCFGASQVLLNALCGRSMAAEQTAHGIRGHASGAAGVVVHGHRLLRPLGAMGMPTR